MARKGKFVVFEGPADAGKSTILRMVAARLKRLGHSVQCRKEPTRSAIGRLARSYAKRPRNAIPLACLIAADRYRLVEDEIKPALCEGRIVLLERYVPSSLVYQVMH